MQLRRVGVLILLCLVAAVGSTARRIAAATSVPACGPVLTVYGGVAAYSNGADQGTGRSCARPELGTYGFQFQCVEFVKRFYSLAKGVNTLPWHGNADAYFTTAYDKGLVRFQNGGAVRPAPDDVLVFQGGSFGHVAIVTNVEAETVAFAEQNWSVSRLLPSLPLVGASNVFSVASRLTNQAPYSVQGWARRPSGSLSVDGQAAAAGLRGSIFTFDASGFTPNEPVIRVVERTQGATISQSELLPRMRADAMPAAGFTGPSTPARRASEPSRSLPPAHPATSQAIALPKRSSRPSARRRLQ
jgi:surface antigen